MHGISMHWFILVFNNMVFCHTTDCIIGNVENNQLPCCTNYFWENEECKECLPGYFGTNCSIRCIYPNYGKRCQYTCDCTVTDCNPVHGCQGNYSQNGTSTVITMSTISSMRDKTKKNNTDKKNPGNDNLTLAIILVGCVLLCLFVLTGVPWIFKSIRRNCTELLNAEDNDTYRLETVYVEINEQQESQDNTIGATVLTRSCTSLDGEETRPELPARNNQHQKTNTTHTNKDDETDIVQN
ncbi:uncharacterized protein LOC128156631 [Crassostrea angulata]|uniref:uncharacterized protein LOC128156631 n=1 Tax=Magallana angulata TaxID=2784310 RepID=UPI0022B1DC19|nr:uncharacterized protein LOC128156631 [Crassostrea angulata]